MVIAANADSLGAFCNEIYCYARAFATNFERSYQEKIAEFMYRVPFGKIFENNQ